MKGLATTVFLTCFSVNLFAIPHNWQPRNTPGTTNNTFGNSNPNMPNTPSISSRPKIYMPDNSQVNQSGLGSSTTSDTQTPIYCPSVSSASFDLSSNYTDDSGLIWAPDECTDDTCTTDGIYFSYVSFIPDNNFTTTPDYTKTTSLVCFYGNADSEFTTFTYTLTDTTDSSQIVKGTSDDGQTTFGIGIPTDVSVCSGDVSQYGSWCNYGGEFFYDTNCNVDLDDNPGVTGCAMYY